MTEKRKSPNSFVEFLAHFLPHVLSVFPVETHITGLVLNTIGLNQTGQRLRNARKHTLIAILFLQLDLFPILQNLRNGGGFSPP